MNQVRLCLLITGAAVSGCDASVSRDSTPAGGIGGGKTDDPVTFIEEDNYGPIAEYLHSNADFPIPNANGADDGGGAGDNDSADDGANDGADDGANDGADDGSCSGFKCNDGTCIETSWKCDEIDECPNAEDEADCPADGSDGNDGNDGKTCNGFACNDGECIQTDWKCDQIEDCSAGEDEVGCPGTNDSSGETCSGFSCNDGTCIDSGWVCDELLDCQGGEDEASCASDGDGASIDVAFAAEQDTQAISHSCLAIWTGVGAGAGAAAAKSATASCVGGGIAIGFVSGGTGFAVAGACGITNASQIDAITGAVFGALSYLAAGLVLCEGGALDLATQAFEEYIQTRSVPLYQVEPKDKACEPCAAPQGVPEPARVDCVPPSKPHHPCKSHHWHVYSWQVNQNPETCECHNNKREDVLCYDPVGDPDIASDPIWDVCL